MLPYDSAIEATANFAIVARHRYLVLANMLSSSDINPFDSAEAKALSGKSVVCGVVVWWCVVCGVW
jgi:hypothetical protein